MKGMIRMKSIFKRVAAGVLALAMCVSLTGCYSEDKTWAAKMGDTTLPIGSYIYYYTSAYSEGAAQVNSESEVLKSDIDGQSASAWIDHRTLDYVHSYYYVDSKFDELGLTLSDEDLESIDVATASMWSYYKTAFEEIGVAENSFREAYAVYNTKLSLLLQAMYGQGGELEVSESEMHDYYTDKYIYYQYFRVDLTETDEDGNTVDMDDDRKAEIKEILEDYAEDVTKGTLTLDHAADNYANLSDTESTLGDPVAVQVDSLSDSFRESLTDLKVTEAAFIETGTSYYVAQRLDIEDDFEALMADENRVSSLIAEMEGDGFVDFTTEEGAKLDSSITINNKAISAIKTSKIADTMGKNGTSYASSEDESTDTGSESSEESAEDSGGE